MVSGWLAGGLAGMIPQVDFLISSHRQKLGLQECIHCVCLLSFWPLAIRSIAPAPRKNSQHPSPSHVIIARIPFLDAACFSRKKKNKTKSQLSFIHSSNQSFPHLLIPPSKARFRHSICPFETHPSFFDRRLDNRVKGSIHQSINPSNRELSIHLLYPNERTLATHSMCNIIYRYIFTL